MFRFFSLIVTSFFLSSCGQDTIIDYIEEQVVDNNDSTLVLGSNSESIDSTKTVLPDKTKKEVLKILAIGNSFTDDGMAFLPDLIYNAGLHYVKLGKIVVGGTSLEYHYAHNNDNVYNFFISEGGKNFSYEGLASVNNAINHDQWDIVVMQQVSQFSGMYQTFQPYLDSLIALVHRQLPKAIIAWHMTWAYGSKSGHSGFSNYDRDQTNMYNAIYNTVLKAINETNLDLVIPSGVAIQKLRATSVNNPPLDLTRDGSHLDYGAGRYVVACTWFEALIAQVYHTSIIGNATRTDAGNVPVTDDNALICQQAASDAIKEFKQKTLMLKD